MEQENNIRKESKVFFFLLFGLVIFLSFKVTQSLFSLCIIGLLTVTLFNPVYKKILWFFRGSHKIATPITIILVFLTFLIPILAIGAISINQINTFNRDLQDLIRPVDQPESQQSTPEKTQDTGSNEDDNSLEDIYRPFRTDSNSEDEESISAEEESRDEITVTPLKEVELTDQGILIRIENIEEDSGAVELASTKFGSVDIQEILDKVNDILEEVPFINKELTTTDVANFINDIARPVAEFFANQAINFAGTSIAVVTSLIVFIAILASLFPQQRKFREFITAVSPLPNEIDYIYLSRISAMATSMIKGTFTIAIIQGIICGLLMHIVGVKYVLFWTLLCIFLSLIPSGAAIIQIPIAIVLLLTGQIPEALIIILGNILIVGTIDNFLRPFLVSKEASLHPVLVLIGVIGGISAFGFLGFIYGPVIMIFLTTTIEVYIKYYRGK